jgi:uncharacterized protein (TIGR03435 family)
MQRTLLAVVLTCPVAATALVAQQQPAVAGAQFDVVSIKPNKGDVPGGGMRMSPDGSQIMTNVTISQIMMGAAPEPVVEVAGLPDWTKTERYDINAKAPPGFHPTPEQRAEMMRNMIVERMKVAGHVEEVERTTFAMVLARSDGKLGPQLKKSTLDCSPGAAASRPPPSPSTASDDIMQRCGMRMGGGTIESGGMLLDTFVRSLRGFAGGLVNNRTGLEGYYALTLHFALPRLNADPSAAASDDAPSFFTALQEQLGLKLVPEKTKVKIFVVDHIERPTPD